MVQETGPEVRMEGRGREDQLGFCVFCFLKKKNSVESSQLGREGPRSCFRLLVSNK